MGLMNVAVKLSDLRLQLFRIEYECDDHAKECSREAQKILNDALAELESTRVMLDLMQKENLGS